MPRTVEVSIAGQTYEMPVNFAASNLIDQQGDDPLRLAHQMSKDRKMLSSAQIIRVITAGVRSAGCELEPDKIGDDIIDAGVQNYLNTATKYIVALVSGSPDKALPKSKKKPA